MSVQFINFNEVFACFDKGCCPNAKRPSMLGAKVPRPAGFAAYDSGEGLTYRRPEMAKNSLDGDIQDRTKEIRNDQALPLADRRTDERAESEVDENFNPDIPARNQKGKLKSRFGEGQKPQPFADRSNIKVSDDNVSAISNSLRSSGPMKNKPLSKSVSPTGDPLNPGVPRPEYPPPPSESRALSARGSIDNTPWHSMPPGRDILHSSFRSSRGSSLGQPNLPVQSSGNAGAAPSALSVDPTSLGVGYSMVGPARPPSLGSEATAGGNTPRGGRLSWARDSTASGANSTSQAASISSTPAGVPGTVKSVSEPAAAVEEPRVGVGIVCFERLDGSIAVDYVTQCSSVYGQVQSGDVITSVNGRDVKGLGVPAVQQLLFGPAFTHVLLGVTRRRTGSELASGRKDLHVNILCVRR